MLNNLYNVIKLIELIKNRPAIYDYTLKEHSYRHCVKKLWKEIGDEIGVKPYVCKRKWGSLRDTMMRNMHKEYKPQTKIPDKRQRKWYLADRLHFLRKFLLPNIKSSKRSSIADPADKNFLTKENDYPILNGEYTVHENNVLSDVSAQDVFNEQLRSERTNKFNFNYDNRSIASPNFSKAKPQTKNFLVNDHLRTSHSLQDKSLDFDDRSQSSCTIEYLPDEHLESDEQNIMFFKSIIPDILRLPEKKQRLYKKSVLIKLNRFLEEEES